MFGFLKDKLKTVINKFTKKVEEEGKEEKVEVEKKVLAKEKPKKPAVEKKPLAKPKEKPAVIPEKPKETLVPEKPKAEEKPPLVVEEKPKVKEVKEEKKGIIAKVKEKLVKPKKLEAVEAKPEEKPPEKKGIFKRITETITTKKISEKQFDELFWDLELALIENNAAVEVVEKIKQDLKTELVNKPIPRTKVQNTIMSALRESISDLFRVEPLDLVRLAEEKKPFVICFVGVNGSGKTTTIAKIAKLFKDQGKNVVVAAADTFRAAAIEQLQQHADRLGVKLIKHAYGADPAAVAFDAIKHAEATGKDVVLIDTAGRLHSNTNLMDEMRKIVRVASPDLKIFVGESITGNDCVEQAKEFNNAVGIDGIILAKADVDEKGGAAISVSYVTKKPVLYLGVGQEYDDLQKFSKDKLLASIGL